MAGVVEPFSPTSDVGVQVQVKAKISIPDFQNRISHLRNWHYKIF